MLEVVEGSPAAKEVEAGDFLVDIVNPRNGSSMKCAWLPLSVVLDTIEARPPPIALRLRRGGVEPWQLDRDGSGLSVDEMMRAASSQYGRLIDEDQEEALRTAFAAIKEQEKRTAADSAAKGGYESETLQTASQLSFELRSFVQVARRDARGVGSGR